MTTRYTYAATLSWGGDTPTAELEVECSYTVSWGAPAQGPSYASGGQPADPDEIDDIKIISVDGKPWPVDLSHGFQTEAEDADMLVEKLMNDHYDRMLENASEEDAARYDDAREMREDAE